MKNIAEMMATGTPYRVVEYGAEIEGIIQSWPDELYPRFWREKEEAFYEDFPYQRVGIPRQEQ